MGLDSGLATRFQKFFNTFSGAFQDLRASPGEGGDCSRRSRGYMKTFLPTAADASADSGGATPWLRRALDRWFYFGMAWLILLVVAYGFGRGLGGRLLHPAASLPWILHVHALVFCGWVLLFLVQSGLARRRALRLHRQLGMFGAGLGTVLPVLGVATALVMRQWHASRGPADDAFLAVSFNDMLTFSVAFGLALHWRGRPELHRRLMLIASCALTVAAFARFPRTIVPAHAWYAGVDLLIGLGLLRDGLVDGRVHRVYLIGLPAVMAGQALALHLALAAPAGWLALLHAWLG
jgi:hypothetical protein